MEEFREVFAEADRVMTELLGASGKRSQKLPVLSVEVLVILQRRLQEVKQLQ